MTANQRVGGPERIQLLTVEEAAEMLREHVKTVYRKVSLGQLPWVNIAPPGQRAKIRFRQDQLNAFISDRSYPVTDKSRRAAA